MQTTDQNRAQHLAAEYAKSKHAAAAGVAYRRALVTEMLTLHTRAEVAALLGVSTQRVSEIVGGVRE